MNKTRRTKATTRTFPDAARVDLGAEVVVVRRAFLRPGLRGELLLEFFDEHGIRGERVDANLSDKVCDHVRRELVDEGAPLVEEGALGASKQKK